MNAVHDEVQVAHDLIIGQIALRMEHPSVKEVLNQRKEEETADCSDQREEQIESLPGGNAVHHVGDQQPGQHEDVVPLVVGEGFEEGKLEHPGRGHEQPVRRIYHFHVGIVVEVPYLRQKRFFWINNSGYLFLESADDH